METEQWVLMYDGGFWSEAFIKYSGAFEISGVGKFERTTIFTNEAKKQEREKIATMCKEKGLIDLAWKRVVVTLREE